MNGENQSGRAQQGGGSRVKALALARESEHAREGARALPSPPFLTLLLPSTHSLFAHKQTCRCLARYDAGVPLKKAVAGVAMGLLLPENLKRGNEDDKAAIMKVT